MYAQIKYGKVEVIEVDTQSRKARLSTLTRLSSFTWNMCSYPFNMDMTKQKINNQSRFWLRVPLKWNVHWARFHWHMYGSYWLIKPSLNFKQTGIIDMKNCVLTDDASTSKKELEKSLQRIWEVNINPFKQYQISLDRLFSWHLETFNKGAYPGSAFHGRVVALVESRDKIITEENEILDWILFYDEKKYFKYSLIIESSNYLQVVHRSHLKLTFDEKSFVFE
jgi:hypothetical protein